MSLRALARSIPAVVRRDYLATTAVHWLTLASGLLLFHLVARRASTSGFAYYQVARGAVATIQPFALIGLVPALHKYLPRSGDRARTLALQAFLIQVVVMDVFGLLGLLLAGDLGRLLGIPGGAPAVRAVVVLAAGNCLVVVAMAALRGTGQIRLSNAVSLLGLGLLPLLAFVVTTRIDVFLAVQGAATAAAAFAGIVLVRHHVPSPRRHTPPPPLRLLLRFGIRRAPGEIALPALFAFPTFYVAGADPGSPSPGYLGFATSAITLICSVFGMLTPVLLPRLSSHFQTAPTGRLPGAGPAAGGGARLARGLKTLPIAAAVLATLAVVFLSAVAPVLVRGFLGPEFHGAVRVLRLALPASIPFAAFYAARPALDALHETPVISRLLLACLAAEIALTYATAGLCSPAASAIVGLMAASALLGALSYAALLRAIPA